jgi:hypothetical protein
MPPQKRIFLSHASADRDLADLFRNTLILGGVAESRIFYSSGRGTGIPSGEEVSAYLRRSLIDAGLVIELLSETFLTRPMCLMELGGAWTMGTPTYPIVVPPLSRGEAIKQIGNVQAGVLGTDVEVGEIFDELHDRLAQDVGIRCPLTAWNRAIDAFRKQLPSALATAQAAGRAPTMHSVKVEQEHSREESPDHVRQDRASPATEIAREITSRLAQELSSLNRVRHPFDNSAASNSAASNDEYLVLQRYANLQSILNEILDSVDREPRLMDAIMGEAHQLVEGFYDVLKRQVFGPGDPLDPSKMNPGTYSSFEAARAAENDMYELYENDVERYRSRQLDKLDVVLKRRRAYISTLQAVGAHTSAILGYLRKFRA